MLTLNEITTGNAVDLLPQVPEGSVHCCVTSPPYWGLRDYGLPPQVWDDPGGCEHEWRDATIIDSRHLPEDDPTLKQATNVGSHQRGVRPGAFCLKCNAWRGSLGLEPTPELYIQHVVEIFREIRRVLRKDGTCWLNMGDSYCGYKGDNYMVRPETSQLQSKSTVPKAHEIGTPQTSGLKPKNLCGIPWRLALALQADGWWLRSDIIWSKLNPMPESVTDRPTRSHEYVFLLTQSGASQYWTHRDFSGVRKRPQPDYRWSHATGYETEVEPENWRTSIIVCPVCKGEGREALYSDQESLFGGDTIFGYADCRKCNKRRNEAATVESEEAGHRGQILQPGKVFEWDRTNLWRGHDYFYDAEAVREPGQIPGKMPDGWDTGPGAHGTIHRQGREKGKKAGHNNALDNPRTPDPKKKQDALGKNTYTGFNERYAENPVYGRNLRSVWNIPTQPYPDAHFATFPEKLVARCILAGTSEKGACECGAPWARVVEKSGGTTGKGWHNHQNDLRQGQRGGTEDHKRAAADGYEKDYKVETLDWWPTCECGREDVRPCVVLDPFIGSGTVGKVAQDLGRDWIGIELNTDYCEMARKRTVHRQERLDLA